MVYCVDDDGLVLCDVVCVVFVFQYVDDCVVVVVVKKLIFVFFVLGYVMVFEQFEEVVWCIVCEC